MGAVIVIPARYGSTRFPGKPLVKIAGTSLIQRVYERCAASREAAVSFVATDDARIRQHVEEFGGRCVEPQGDFLTGTDRIAAALPLIEKAERQTFDIVVNVQGDEPLIEIETVDTLIRLLRDTDSAMATMACPLADDGEFESRDIVKVAVDARFHALYFSRAPIGSPSTVLRHIGVYAYRRDALARFVGFEQAPLERAESLEQLRALHHGFRIAVLQTSKPHHGVDRPEDVARVENELAKPHG